MPGGPLLAAYVLERTTDVDEDQRLFLEVEKAEEDKDRSLWLFGQKLKGESNRE